MKEKKKLALLGLKSDFTIFFKYKKFLKSTEHNVGKSLNPIFV